MLTRDGHRTITASNGMEAFEQFKKHKFDLVLMDIQMPEVDGLQACRMIRQWEQEQAAEATPIIALTASVLEQDRKDASTAGMNGFASKPIVRTELHYEIARCLGLIKTETAPTQNKNEPTRDIDWQSAEQRWGDRATLTKAIQNFCADNTKPTAFFMQPENQHKHLEAQQEAHRIKGAAANLGLISLMQVAQQIEQSETINADLFEQMKTTLENIIAQTKPTETDKTNSATHYKWNRALLEKLLAAYSHGTFDDEAYRELTKTISSELIAPLEQALDQFDFDLAATIIQSWIGQSTSAQEV